MHSDTVITDMDSEIPFESSYSVNGGQCLVIYGTEDLLSKEKKYVAIRNCQWYMDPLYKWASFATTHEIIERNGEVLSNSLKRPSNWEADDQSGLVYVLITERERSASKVENTDVDMSATCSSWTPRFLDEVPLSYKPFVTHLAGCTPCETPCGDEVSEKCLTEMDRAFHFADSQVLESTGLCHEHLTRISKTYRLWGHATRSHHVTLCSVDLKQISL